MGLKSFLKYVFILVLLNMTSCQLLPEPENFNAVIDIILKNESGVPIQIKAYFKGIQYDDFILQNQEEKINKFNEYSPARGFPAVADTLKQNSLNVFKNVIKKIPEFGENGYLYGMRDSVIIIFDKKRKIIQNCKNYSDLNCLNIPKNLVFISNEKNRVGKQKTKTNWIKKENFTGKFKLILGKEDYDRATTINN